jgi:hypothetical protein
MRKNQLLSDNQPSLSDPQMESLKYQLDILKSELQSIDQIIERMDEITQTTKNWAIVTWAGIIAIAIGQPDLRIYIVFTFVLPLFFWLIDAHWRHLQRRSIFRVLKIQEFLNDGRLLKSFQRKMLADFIVYDPIGHQYRGLPEYENYVSTWSVLNFESIRNFYLGLALISLALGLFFIYVH